MPGWMHPKGSDLMRAAAKLALIAGCLALCACAAGPRVPRYTERFEREVRTTANPGSVAARDIAFARAAREDGGSSAFDEFAAADAVIHDAEGPIDVAVYFARRSASMPPRQWTPQAVWSSCDGQTAISQGKYADPDGQWGYYATVWERQRDYDYAFAYHIAAPDAALTARENAERDARPTGDDVIVVRAIPMITGEVADCPGEDALSSPLPARGSLARPSTRLRHGRRKPDRRREVEGRHACLALGPGGGRAPQLRRQPLAGRELEAGDSLRNNRRWSLRAGQLIWPNCFSPLSSRCSS